MTITLTKLQDVYWCVISKTWLEVEDIMWSPQCPLRTGLPREVVLWLHNLALAPRLKNVRRDFSNGYLVAGIFSQYYPKVFLLYSYDNGASLSIKQENWRRIQKYLQKLNVNLCKDLINGTIHLEMGAAEKLLLEIYTILTKQSRGFGSRESDYNGSQHQRLVNPKSRSTSSGDLRISVNMAQSDLSTDKKKSKDLLHRDQDHRERIHNSELCSSSSSQVSVPFKEIKVHQPIRRFIQQ